MLNEQDGYRKAFCHGRSHEHERPARELGSLTWASTRVSNPARGTVLGHETSGFSERSSLWGGFITAGAGQPPCAVLGGELEAYRKPGNVHTGEVVEEAVVADRFASPRGSGSARAVVLWVAALVLSNANIDRHVLLVFMVDSNDKKSGPR